MEAVRFSFAAKERKKERKRKKNAVLLHYILNCITLQSVMTYSVDEAQSTATVA
jgi:hypothetical protein